MAKTNSGTTTFNMRIETDLKNKLRAAAAKDGMSDAQFVRECLKQGLVAKAMERRAIYGDTA